MGAMTAIRIRAIRRQMGWSREDLARLLGVSVACIGRVERGEQELDKDMQVHLEAALGSNM